MKTSYFYPLLLLSLLFLSFGSYGQENTERRLELKLTDPATQTSHTYRLNNANYSLSSGYYPYYEADPTSNGSCVLSLELADNADSFLLKWVSGEMKEMKGTVTVVAKDNKKARNMAFTGGIVAGSSESFYTTDGNAYMQLSLYLKTLSVDNITIYKFIENNRH